MGILFIIKVNMKFIQPIFLLSGTTFALTGQINPKLVKKLNANLKNGISLTNLWVEYKSIFQKHYDLFEKDEEKFQIFKDKVFKIKQHNSSGKFSHTLGLNQFSDMTDQEFQDQILMDLPYPEEEMEFECPYKFQSQTIPDKFKTELDWRDSNKNPKNKVAVTPVKDQASCGSCYTFSAMASMESSLCMNGYQDCNTWTGLSEQQTLDCGSYNMKYDDTDRPHYGYGGCGGGWQSNVWQYIHWNRGIMNGEDYPYESGNSTKFPDSSFNIGECRYDHSKAVAVPNKIICGTTNKEKADTDLMKQAVAHKGALAIGMYVGGTFRDMESGVYDNAVADCPQLEKTGINHAMTVVGYGYDNTAKKDYWIVKNSWGSSYAMGGYVKVAIGKNICGIEGNVQYTEANDNIPKGFSSYNRNTFSILTIFMVFYNL